KRTKESATERLSCPASLISFCRELVNRSGMKALTCLQHSRWEVRMIWRIGEMLRLETHTGPIVVDLSLFAVSSSIEKISSVELDPGLSGANFQQAPALRFIEFSSQGQDA